ncbi:MAG: hypothetical protein IIA45_11130 [Bacteroidetes bacterium]|nr:hypothetical protein [Bacteroidota bacterium]
MKNKINLNGHVIDENVKRKLQKLIDEKHIVINKNAINHAKALAKKGLPEENSGSLRMYAGSIIADYNLLIAKIKEELQPIIPILEGMSLAKTADQKKAPINQKIEELRKQIIQVDIDLIGHEPEDIKSMILIVLIPTFIILFGEVYFINTSLQIIGETPASSWPIAGSIGVTIFLITHVVPMAIKAVASKLHKALIFITSLIVISGGFYLLAIIRSEYLSEVLSIEITPLLFVFFNLMFLFASGLLSFFIAPTWQEIKNNWQAMRLSRIKRKKENEIAWLENKKVKIDEEVESVKSEARHRFRDACDLEDSVIAYKDVSVNSLISVNLLKREDDIHPECFEEEIPDLNCFFNNLKTDDYDS